MLNKNIRPVVGLNAIRPQQRNSFGSDSRKRRNTSLVSNKSPTAGFWNGMERIAVLEIANTNHQQITNSQ
jgi:hypothetical protein